MSGRECRLNENGEPEEKILLYTGFTPEQLAVIREGRLRGTE